MITNALRLIRPAPAPDPWDTLAAETDHRMVMRIAGRVGGAQRLDPDETLDMFRRHVSANPACPLCRELIRGPS